MTALRDRVDRHLEVLHPTLTVDDRWALAERIVAAVGLDGGASVIGSSRPVLDHPEAMLITYADTIREAGYPPLEALARFLDDHVADAFDAVHVLPFYPASSDGGFAVVDHRAVAEHLGGWRDVARLAGRYRLMFDFVCNHGSAESEWFTQFRLDEPPGRDYFLTAEPDTDLSSVVRPRTHPLLVPVETARGLRYVWATFSADQPDFDYSNPDVLVEFCSILAAYLTRGATSVRLDAICYLWKRLGGPCIHLPETHEIVKLFRTIVDAHPVAARVVTETNVPHAENVAYFGRGDEAHLVYNFTLAPLVVAAALTETTTTLTSWLAGLDPPPTGCTYLNFIASHDGLGLRPIEGLVDRAVVEVMLARAAEVGGSWSDHATPTGPRPYEINASLADLLAGRDGSHADRFVAAHALLLAIRGIAAIYIHSLLASPGDRSAVERTGHRRDVNRPSLTRAAADRRLSSGWRAQVFGRLLHLLRVRRAHDAFAPQATQVVHDVGPTVVAIERRGASSSVLAAHNLSAQPTTITLPAAHSTSLDLISGHPHRGREVSLDGWQAVWLTPVSRSPAAAATRPAASARRRQDRRPARR